MTLYTCVHISGTHIYTLAYNNYISIMLNIYDIYNIVFYGYMKAQTHTHI